MQTDPGRRHNLRTGNSLQQRAISRKGPVCELPGHITPRNWGNECLSLEGKSEGLTTSSPTFANFQNFLTRTMIYNELYYSQSKKRPQLLIFELHSFFTSIMGTKFFLPILDTLLMLFQIKDKTQNIILTLAIFIAKQQTVFRNKPLVRCHQNNF